MFEKSVNVPHCPRKLMLGESRILKVTKFVMMKDMIMVRVTPLAVLDWPGLEKHPELRYMAQQHSHDKESWADFFFWQ